MFKWFRAKEAVSAKQENLGDNNVIIVKPLDDEPHPVHREVCRVTFGHSYVEKSSSVKLRLGFCEGCDAENKLLVTNHTARLYGCFRKQCFDRLVKVLLVNEKEGD
jgi:hypothetical protein